MTNLASRCMPTTESDAAEYWKCSPQKYRPGSDSTMPRTVCRLAALAEHRDVEPRKRRSESGTPHDGGNVEHLAVVGDRPTVRHRDDARHPTSDGRDVLRLDPHER